MDNPCRLLPQADGWFVINTRCPAGTRYRYNIDGELEVPDPASRAQAGDIDQHSVVVDPLAYPWQHSTWAGRPWNEAVIYELHVGALGGFQCRRAALGAPGRAGRHRDRVDAHRAISR
jgi:maltooligosyltrehalose trehalohydrolase